MLEKGVVEIGVHAPLASKDVKSNYLCRVSNWWWRIERGGRGWRTAWFKQGYMRLGLRGHARYVAPRASADVASAAWSGRALAVGVKKDLGGLDV